MCSKATGSRTCCVHGCKSSTRVSPKTISFHGFPKDEKQCLVWLENCNRKELIDKIKNYKICSLHFDSNMFAGLFRSNRLKKDAVPTLFAKKDVTAVTTALEDEFPSRANRHLETTSERLRRVQVRNNSQNQRFTLYLPQENQNTDPLEVVKKEYKQERHENNEHSKLSLKPSKEIQEMKYMNRPNLEKVKKKLLLTKLIVMKDNVIKYRYFHTKGIKGVNPKLKKPTSEQTSSIMIPKFEEVFLEENLFFEAVEGVAVKEEVQIKEEIGDCNEIQFG